MCGLPTMCVPNNLQPLCAHPTQPGLKLKLSPDVSMVLRRYCAVVWDFLVPRTQKKQLSRSHCWLVKENGCMLGMFLLVCTSSVSLLHVPLHQYVGTVRFDRQCQSSPAAMRRQHGCCILIFVTVISLASCLPRLKLLSRWPKSTSLAQ